MPNKPSTRSPHFRGVKTLLIVLIAGCLLPFALAPHDIYPLAFLCPAVLLYCWLQDNWKQAFWHGLLFGLGYFAVGSWWLYISIHHFGNATPVLAAFITFLFILLMACYAATQGLVIRLFFKTKPEWLTCLCLFPATWVLWEWIRSFLMDGFPFLFIGYSQLVTPLHGIAPIFGTYGLSLAVALISGALVVLCRQTSTKAKFSSVVTIVGIAVFGFAASGIRWTSPNDKPLTVSLVQGNIPQSLKWDPEEMLNIVGKYRRLTNAHWSSDLIVWPEAAVPFFPNELPDFFDALNRDAKTHNSYVIFGAPLKNIETKQYYNGMLMLGKGHGRYMKRRLVPYGEFIPLKDSLGKLMAYFKIPMANTTVGPANQPPIIINGTPITLFICYESAFPIEGLNAIKGTGLIINISDDAWFGQSWALYQQLQMTQMRALETGRYALAATNTGITALINPMGKLLQQVPIDKTDVLTGQVFMMQGKTPLMRWSYYPIFFIITLLLLFGIFFRNRKKHPSTTTS